MKSRRKTPLANASSVNVSTLKTHLGRFLRQVRRGVEVTVFDRQTPVAKIVAYSDDNEALSVVKASTSMVDVFKAMRENERRHPLKKELSRSIQSLLDEDRGSK